MEHLSNYYCHNNSHKLYNETRHPVDCSMETDNNLIRIPQWKESIVKQTLVSEDRNKSERARLRVRARDP